LPPLVTLFWPKTAHRAWTKERLLAFFGNRPVPNGSTAPPKVKSGEVVPEALDADTALAMMIADPLLIRRPLIEAMVA